MVDHEKANLTPKEIDLLLYMVKNRNIALSRMKLLEEVWDYDYFGDDRTVDIAAAGQQNIARAQLIGTAFNDIINVSRQEKEDFVERMLVKFHIRRNAVKVVMKLKIFFLHELPRSKFFFMYIQ